MRKLFKIIALCVFGFLIPELLFAQSQGNYAKKSSKSASQDKITTTKDTSVVQRDSSHVSKGIMIPNMITPSPVKSKMDTSKNNPANEKFLKRMPAQSPEEQK